LASFKSATAMASAAVTAASAAAASVPFELSLGCLPAESDSGELFDRKARRVHIFDGHDLLGHPRSLAVVGGSLDYANHRCDLSSELRPGKRALGL
jgi:hypothetical protein